MFSAHSLALSQSNGGRFPYLTRFGNLICSSPAPNNTATDWFLTVCWRRQGTSGVASRRAVRSGTCPRTHLKGAFSKRLPVDDRDSIGIPFRRWVWGGWNVSGAHSPFGFNVCSCEDGHSACPRRLVTRVCLQRQALYLVRLRLRPTSPMAELQPNLTQSSTETRDKKV